MSVDVNPSVEPEKDEDRNQLDSIGLSGYLFRH
jgi:hypothetical protein